MPRTIEPPALPRQPGRYSQAILVGPATKRLVTTPQTGVKPDGTYAEDLQAQLDQAFDNILVLLGAAGLETRDLIRVAVFTRVRGAATACAAARDARLGAVKPVWSYREVVGFADPDCLVEIEAEAVREG